MRKMIIATLPTVALNKLKIVKLFQIDFLNNNINNGVHSTGNDYSLALSYLDDKLLYLLKNNDNVNIDLLIDEISSDILEIANNYFDTEIEINIEDNYYLGTGGFTINDSVIIHELYQILNDIFILNTTYNFKYKDICSFRLLLPDGVIFDIRD